MIRLLSTLLVLLVCGCPESGAPRPSVTARGTGAAPAPVARVDTERAWVDLLAQRPSAVVKRHGAVHIDLSREAARAHVSLLSRSAWRLGQEVAGRGCGVVEGRSASLDVPLDGELAPALAAGDADNPGLAMALEVRAMVPKQSMTVLLNERPLAHLTLGQGWQRRTLSLPADLVRPGENRIRFHFRHTGQVDGRDVSAAIASVEIGTHARITGPAPLEQGPAYHMDYGHDSADAGRLRVGAASGSAGSALVLAEGSALVYYLVPPRRGRLSLHVAGQGALAVSVSTDEDHEKGRAPTVLLGEPLRPTGHQTSLDLTAWGGAPVRLEISVQGDPTAHARLLSARVEARRTVPVDRRARHPRDVIILAVEGLRADALEMGRRPPLPAIDEFLAGGLMFERAYAASPAAVPSHAAWMSSVAPPVHLTVRGTFVAESQTLLPEALGRAGYVRVLASANSDVGFARGLAQGIDKAILLEGAMVENSALAVVQAGLKALEGKAGRRFLIANVNDPQAPYEPPRELLRNVVPVDGAPLPHLTHIWVGRVRLGKTTPTPDELKYIRRLYRGELQVVDQALATVMSDLRAQGRLESAIVVLVGVHGEEFAEHGGAGHARTLYEESLRVPLVIHAPQLLAPGRVTTSVDLLDLAPTLVDLLGLPMPDSWQGASLVPVIDDPQPPPRVCIAHMGDGSTAAIVGEHKLVLGPGRQERYVDLGANPGELGEARSTGGIGLRLVRTALVWHVQHLRRWRRARWGTGANLKPAFARDLGM